MKEANANFLNRKTVILLAAFAAVYIFWGSTYLAIKYAIETLPPFLMAGTRFHHRGRDFVFRSRDFPKIMKNRNPFIGRRVLSSERFYFWAETAA